MSQTLYSCEGFTFASYRQRERENNRIRDCCQCINEESKCRDLTAAPRRRWILFLSWSKIYSPIHIYIYKNNVQFFFFLVREFFFPRSIIIIILWNGSSILTERKRKRKEEPLQKLFITSPVQCRAFALIKTKQEEEKEKEKTHWIQRFSLQLV